METTVNERIKLLRTSLNLTQNQFANSIESTLTTVSRLENGGSKPQLGTIRAIIRVYNVNSDWLNYGTGEMFETPKEVSQSANPWKDALITELKSEVEFLKQLLMNVTGKASANFNDAFDLASLLDGKSIESVRVAA